MSVDDDALHDALRAAADRQPPTTGDLEAVRAGGRRRQQRRTRLLAAVTVLVLAVAGASAAALADRSDDDDVQTAATAGPATTPAGTWVEVPPAPLSTRGSVVSAWTGDAVLLVGGATSVCPPGAACGGPPDPGLADGAILDLATRTWRTISPSPVPFAYASTAALDGIVYVRTEIAMLAYDVAADTWRQLPVPPGTVLVATDDAIVAYRGSDEIGELPYQVLDPATDTWTDLPADPLSPAFMRELVWSAPHLYAFDHELVPQPNSEVPSIVRAARYDPATGQWERLPDSDILGGFGPASWYAEGGLLVNPSLGGADGGEVNGWGRPVPFGGIFDTATGMWTTLPPAPSATSNGVVGTTGGRIVSSTAGLLLDLATMTWVDMPAAPDTRPDDQYRQLSVVPAGRDALAFLGDDGILGTAWLWRSG